MSDLFTELKKENKQREKRLNILDRNLLSDMMGYLKAKQMCDYDIEMARKNLIREALRSYGRKKSLKTIVGNDYRKYCDELCVNMRKTTTVERIFGRGMTVLLALALMYIVRLIDTVIAGGNFLKTPVEINLGYILATCAILVGTFLIYYHFRNILKSKDQKMSKMQIAGIFAILIIIIALAYAAVYFLSSIHLFNVIWWIPAVILIILIAAFYIIYIRHENHIAKEA